MPRPQFTLRALLVAMLVVAAFFAGRHFEREQRLREQQAARDAAAAAKGETLEALGSIVGSNSTAGFDPQNPTLTTAGSTSTPP